MVVRDLLEHIDPVLGRFVLGGLFNTLVVYLLFALFIYAGVHYTLATLIAGALGVVIGYFTMSRWVFRTRRRKRFVHFSLLFTAMYFLSIAIQTVVLRTVIANEYVAGAIALVVTSGISFLVNRYLVFRD